MNKILLDTNAYSKMISGSVPVIELTDNADEICLSIFVIAEVKFGFYNGARMRENLHTLQEFLREPMVIVLQAGADTAEFFAHIRTGLKKAGTPIPINDIWIAAHAMETGAQLVTFDRHFELIPGLRVQVVE